MILVLHCYDVCGIVGACLDQNKQIYVYMFDLLRNNGLLKDRAFMKKQL